MRIKVPYKYTEEVVPKHCRKARRMPFEGSISLLVHEVTGQEAQVAIREHTRVSEHAVIEYRWWGEKLWVVHSFNRYSHGPYETQTVEQFAQDPWPMTNGPNDTWYRSKQQTRAGLMNWARSILFVNGVRWKLSGEPRYVIMTFGLGHNHGHPGTTLSSTNSYNSNISKRRYFRIDQHDLALTTAIAIAEHRGDDKAISFIKEYHETFDILIPEAIRLNLVKEHGEGDPFINKLEDMIESSPNAMVAGLMVMREGMKVVEELKERS